MSAPPPSQVQATVLVDELVRGGVTEAVLAPGSRNAPLSFALRDAELAGRLRLHVRIDERTAGFLALGLAARSGRPVPVTCTSGTAAANLHPAVLEADQSGIGLLVLTADRPPRARAARANQTVEQAGLYGPALRYRHDLGTADSETSPDRRHAYWRSTICRALAAAAAGPVHLNIPFAEPLVPLARPVAVPEGRPAGRPWTVAAPAPDTSEVTPSARRGLVLACGAPVPPEALRWAHDHGWPVIAEFGGVAGAGVLDAGEWLLGDPEFVAAHRPEQVLCVGRPTLTRPVQRLLADPAVEVLAVQDGAAGYWAGDGVSAVGGTAAPPSRPADHEWLAHWRWVSGVARRAVDAVLDEPAPGTGPMSGLRLARDLAAALPDGALLVAGSSNPAREIGLAAAARDGVLLHANRGVGGIDGTISTAVGAALAHEAVAPGGHAVALLGDLTFLHDLTGLVIGPDEPRPDLVIVAADNAGGGIFSLLEQGAREHAAAFERVFGTPVRADLAALCRALDVPVDDLGESDGAEPGDRQQRLVDAIAPRPGSGLRVVRVPVDRAGLREHHARVRAAVRAALAGVPGL